MSPEKRDPKISAEELAQQVCTGGAEELIGDVAKLFAALGVDGGFPFVRPLFRNIAQSCESIFATCPEFEVFLLSIKDAMVSADAIAGINGIPLTAVREKSGYATSYPVAEVLSRKPGVNQGHAIHFFRVMLLLRASRGGCSEAEMRDLAAQLRGAMTVRDQRFGLISKVPVQRGSSRYDLITSINSYLSGCLAEPDLSDNLVRFYQSLIVLLTEGKRARRIASGKDVPLPVVRPTQSPRSVPENTTSFRLAPDNTTESNPWHHFSGSLHEVAASSVGRETSLGEPESNEWGLTLADEQGNPLGSDEFENPDELPQPDELQASLTRSARWLGEHLQKTPVSLSRLNPLERAHFLRNMRRTCSGEVEKKAVLVIYLMYLCGLSIDDLWVMALGQGEELNLEGFIRRKWPLPENAYVPDDSALPMFQQCSREIELPLPSEVCKLLKEVIPDERPPVARFGSALGVSQEVLAAVVSDLLERWRENGRFRITLSRVQGALDNQLSIAYQDPLTSFLLSASSRRKAPNLQYYKATAMSHLLERWRETVEALLDG